MGSRVIFINSSFIKDNYIPHNNVYIIHIESLKRSFFVRRFKIESLFINIYRKITNDCS